MNRHSLSYENHILLGLFMISKPSQTLFRIYIISTRWKMYKSTYSVPCYLSISIDTFQMKIGSISIKEFSFFLRINMIYFGLTFVYIMIKKDFTIGHLQNFLCITQKHINVKISRVISDTSPFIEWLC